MVNYWKNSLTHYEGRIHGIRSYFNEKPDGWAEFAAFESSLCLLQLKNLPDQFSVITKSIESELEALQLQDRALVNQMIRLMKAGKWRKGHKEGASHLLLMEKHFEEVHQLLVKTIELMK